MKTALVNGGLLVTPPKVSGDLTQRKVSQNPSETIYRAVNGTSEQNLTKILDLMGGIEKIIGSSDVVIIKPNVQWWNQGAPNLAALKTFVDIIMERPGGFNGEVVLVENCHRGSSPWQHGGWANGFERNSDVPDVSNINELFKILKEKYGSRFSTCHLIDIGAGGRRIFKPSEGTGYVYCDGSNGVPLIYCENGESGSNRRATIMTYPIIKTDKGTIIDFKHGIWEKGSYTGQPLRFINFTALNHHSNYCGVTSAIKNYMGIADLSGGPDPKNGGLLTKDYYNFHSFPFNKWSPGPEPGMLGAEIAMFMKTIRKADLNITTAEWIGLSSRIDAPIVQTRAVLASADPVALDYHSAKYLLYPNSKISVHNPDNKKSPVYQYLMKCAGSDGGVFDERLVKVISYDFKAKSFQKDDDLVILGARRWGSNPKAVMKYLVLRYWNSGMME